MELDDSKYGIYFSASQSEVVRITSPYWLPEEPEWIFLSSDVNETLSSLRDMIKSNGLVSDSDSVEWGRIPNLN